MLYIAILLGVIEGVTEFIPVSSTGHLIIFGHLFGFEGAVSKTFEIVIQLGAILAVCWLYRQKIIATACGVLVREKKDCRFAGAVMIAFLPAMLAGLVSHRVIKEFLFNPLSVSIALIVGGIVILLVERLKPAVRIASLEHITLPLALKIGLCQCLALIPGTSRSGATIMGAMLFGVDRKIATEFSFFLAMPTMLAATVFDLYGHWSELSFADIQLIAAGFCAAFLRAMLVVRAVVAYVERHGFTPFAYYRIMLGCVMLYFLA